jgi:hypothetical protein
MRCDFSIHMVGTGDTVEACYRDACIRFLDLPPSVPGKQVRSVRKSNSYEVVWTASESDLDAERVMQRPRRR